MLANLHLNRLYNLSLVKFYIVVLSISLLCSVFFFAPSFVAWDLTQSDHFETARTFSLRSQIEDPFRRDIEPSLYWRLLIPLIAYVAQLPFIVILFVPLIGLMLHLYVVCSLVLKFTGRREDAFYATMLTSSFASTWITTGFLGIFIIFPVLALTLIAFLKDKRVLYLVAFLAPWMSEYYVLGIPVALCARYILFRDEMNLPEILKVIAPGVLVYGLIRCIVTALYPEYDANGWKFLYSCLRNTVWYLPYAPLAWWFAYRLGWIYLWKAMASLGSISVRTRVVMICAMIATLTAVTLLGSAMTANVMVFFPLFLTGFLVSPRAFQERYLGLIVVLNFIIPAAYVDFVKFKIKSPLLIELGRLLF